MYEKLVWSSDGMDLTIVECAYPTGSLFNKDEIILQGKNIVINKRSVLGDEKTTLPLNKINKIIFSDGYYWKSVAIEKEGSWNRRVITLYFKGEGTKKLIKKIMKIRAPEIVVTEKSTFLLKLFS